MEREPVLEAFKKFIQKRGITFAQAAFIIGTRHSDFRRIHALIMKPFPSHVVLIKKVLSGELKVRKWYMGKDPCKTKLNINRKNHCRTCGKRIYKERVKKIGN